MTPRSSRPAMRRSTSRSATTRVIGPARTPRWSGRCWSATSTSPGSSELAEGPLEIGVIGTWGTAAASSRPSPTLHDFPQRQGDRLSRSPAAPATPCRRPRTWCWRWPGPTTSRCRSSCRGPARMSPTPGSRAADEIAAAGFQAKFRTGGVEAAAYPDEQELAAVLSALLHHRLKLTAGLHRAVATPSRGRASSSTGSSTSWSRCTGCTPARRWTALPRCSRIATAARWRRSSGRGATTTRRPCGVRSAGSACCGVTEPYEDLVELGLMHERLRAGPSAVRRGGASGS